MAKRQTIALVALLLSAALVSSAQAAGTKLALPLDGSNARLGEATLGDLVADAARTALNADIALVQASELRPSTIPAGDLGEGALGKALMYPEEQLVLIEMPGNTLQEALERSLFVLPQPNPGFLQVSGMTVTFRSGGPAGRRLVSATIGGQALDPGKIYLAAMPVSLAKGAMGYFRVFAGLKTKADSPSPAIGAAVTAYLQANRVISITPGRRIVDLTRAGK